MLSELRYCSCMVMSCFWDDNFRIAGVKYDAAQSEVFCTICYFMCHVESNYTSVLSRLCNLKHAVFFAVRIFMQKKG